MSATSGTFTVVPRFEPATREPVSGRPAWVGKAIQIGGFAALSAYGLDRWSRLLGDPMTARLLGLGVLATTIAAVIPLVRRFAGGPPAAMATFALCLLALPLSGLPWQDFVHLRISLGARHVADGLSGLPAAILPYTGPGRWVPTVIRLGAAVLLLDAAVVLAYSPAGRGDLRRTSAALPLIALAVVPSTLIRPQLPYLQGLLLFVLLASFMWAERVRRRSLSSALALALIAAAGAAVLAPRLDARHPWFDYRAWAGGAARQHVDTFAWNQSYGPLHWPRRGRVVMSVVAPHADYWKAEDLDVFNGTAWVAGAVGAAALPLPDSEAVSRWSQVIKVTIGSMRTPDVIAAGYAIAPTGLQTVLPGASDGTWTVPSPLTPGSSYVTDTYSPRPTSRELVHAGAQYPQRLLAPYRSLRFPVPHDPTGSESELFFPAFAARRAAISVLGFGAGIGEIAAFRQSPYGQVYALAGRLKAGATTPYAYVQSVMRYLHTGFRYTENPPLRADPLAAFLLRDRVGYCQQFSGAMALLLRMGGVPARVATGFTSGSRNGRDGPFLVTDVNAHAWVEVWFPHYGWVRFDPTPTAAPARGGQGIAPILKTLPKSAAHPTSAPRRQAQTASVPAGPTRTGRGSGLPAWPLAMAAALLLIAAGWWLAARRRPLDAEARLHELERALVRTGRPIGPAVTLSQLEQRFGDSPRAAGYVRSLRLSRYAVSGPEPSDQGRRELRRELAAGLGLRGWLRALWALPPRP